MPLCRHFAGLYDDYSKRLPTPVQYLNLALKVSKERPVLPREYVFRLVTTHEGSSSLAQENRETPVGHGSAVRGTGGQSKRCNIQTQGDTYSIRDETRRESGISGQEVGGSEVGGLGGMGVVRDSSGGEPTSSEKKRERQRMVREEVAEEIRRMKRMKGHSEPMIGGDGGDIEERASGKRTPGMRGRQEQGVENRLSKEEGATASKKARRPDGLTIRDGQAMGGGDSAHPGVAAAIEPSEKSKRKLVAEEGDGQKKPRRRKTAEGTTGSEMAVGRQYDEAAAFWLEYEWNDDGETVEKELLVQLLIDPRKVCDIPAWERYYNHRSLTRDGVDDIKGAMLRQFHEEKWKIWTKYPLVLAPITKMSSSQRTRTSTFITLSTGNTPWLL
ncbi:hypothetical protein CBR_g39832 [Chara braunii]|uniref:Uncharacterized protein n=1 Tax=Chara braunii TaxID=69332 RepID=A0A388LSF4_CHABU|nr:hypothetical protein CBR_g39832 [Chara braunii]|eukprot:GBG85264.1 hypothetical protein CBR_g39832 [Chara braunii]